MESICIEAYRSVNRLGDANFMDWRWFVEDYFATIIVRFFSELFI